MRTCLLLIAEATIGFEVSKVNVSEKAGHIRVVVKVLEGNVNNVAVTLSTVEITAKGMYVGAHTLLCKLYIVYSRNICSNMFLIVL